MSDGRRWGLLISGGINHNLNYPRYRNDLDHWCSALQRRQFECTVCYADGAGFPRSDIRIGPATRERVSAELARLEQLEERDLVLILVTNHGDQIGFSLWGGDRFSPSDLAVLLARCRATKVVLMGQCFGGVFASLDLSRTVVVTASSATESSWACADPPGRDSYDEFLYQLASSLFGGREGTSPASRPTLRTAFEQAQTNDRRPESPTISDPEDLAHKLVL